MFESIAISALLFEVGAWFGFGTAKVLGNGAVKESLLHGFDARKAPLPFLDGHLARQTSHTSNLQRKSVSALVRGIRGVVNSRAFELFLLKQLTDRWAARKELSTEVNLFA